jgi:hypothetical protein
MVKAEKLIQWEKTVVPLVMSFVFLYYTITILYTMITGDKVYDIRGRIAVIAILIGFLLYIYLVVVFPRKYPGEFLKYKRHAQKNLDLRKGKIGLFFFLIVALLMLSYAVFSWYKFGLDSELIEIFTLSGAMVALFSLALYFIYLLEK